MSLLAPCGVGLPAPDCFATPLGATEPVRLSELLRAPTAALILSASLGQLRPLFDTLAAYAAHPQHQVIILCADQAANAQQQATPATLDIACDPTLGFAKHYGLACAPNGCLNGLFLLQAGVIHSALISRTIESVHWQSLLAKPPL